MLATTIDGMNIPPLWYPVVQQMQTANEPSIQSDLYRHGKSFYITGTSSTISTRIHKFLGIEQLGWSNLEALETHLRFRNFAEDWDAPGMEAYDDM